MWSTFTVASSMFKGGVKWKRIMFITYLHLTALKLRRAWTLDLFSVYNCMLMQQSSRGIESNQYPRIQSSSLLLIPHIAPYDEFLFSSQPFAVWYMLLCRILRITESAWWAYVYLHSFIFSNNKSHTVLIAAIWMVIRFGSRIGLQFEVCKWEIRRKYKTYSTRIARRIASITLHVGLSMDQNRGRSLTFIQWPVNEVEDSRTLDDTGKAIVLWNQTYSSFGSQFESCTVRRV